MQHDKNKESIKQTIKQQTNKQTNFALPRADHRVRCRAIDHRVQIYMLPSAAENLGCSWPSWELRIRQQIITATSGRPVRRCTGRDWSGRKLRGLHSLHGQAKGSHGRSGLVVVFRRFQCILWFVMCFCLFFVV